MDNTSTTPFYNEQKAGELLGRWPANLILSDNPELSHALPDTGPPCGGVKRTTHKAGMFGIGQPGSVYTQQDGDNKSAALYFKTIPMGEDTP